MPDWVMWILYILIVVVMLGVLIAVHELGHLATAKIFKVYCFEYSIGMGPKVFSKKRKGGETAFSLRAVPFGGFVSMYGETGAVPEGYEEPPEERSLNAIAKWKKAIILVAGVTLNFVLGLTLIYIGDQACPIYYSSYSAKDTSFYYLNSAFSAPLESYIDQHKGTEYPSASYRPSFAIYETEKPGTGLTTQVGILATHVKRYATASATTPEEGEYVITYSPKDVTKNNDICYSLGFYPASNEAPQSLKDIGIDQIPVLWTAEGRDNAYAVSSAADGTTFSLPLRLATIQKDDAGTAKECSFVADDPLFRVSVKSGALQQTGVEIKIIKHWLSFTEAWQQWSVDVPRACGAVVQGFASLFTPNGWQNISGLIGITAAMPTVAAAGGARMVFFFAGMISINLAFFNLLPFPGLDGWALLVTGIEGVTKKKVPAKVQGIVSFIGIVLLFGLMILIAVKDVIGLFVH